jgi:acetylornithine deacetylase/succinyl-diaminopimelate desuccinylase-like protein
MTQSRALVYARSHRSRFLTELMNFVRFPSVSGQPKQAGNVSRCAAWLGNHLKKVGMQKVKVVPTRRHPVVYAEWRQAPGLPTALIYGHYDVQPPDPISEWVSPPFAPMVRENNLYGRGACDDKGQLFTHIKAIECYLRVAGRLPINVKCLFEGEEEIGSPHLTGFVERNRRTLAAQFAVMSDTRMLGPGRPSLTYSIRGQLGLEIEVRGPGHDLHSGNFGGAVHDPLQALCEIIAQLHDKNGRVAIPGFYNRVRRWTKNERSYMERNGPPDKQILRDAETESGWGEHGYSLYERVTVRPSLTVNGISGGYEGVGGKAIIPSRALAKISFRLVPDQDPQEVEMLFRRHIARITPATVKSAVRTNQSAKPAVIDRRHPALHAAAAAYGKAFGVRPVFLRSGGSIPVVSTFQRVLSIPTVLMGFALPDDRIHAPNEKFHLPNFYRGIETAIWFLWEISRQKMGQERLPALTPSRSNRWKSVGYGD